MKDPRNRRSLRLAPVGMTRGTDAAEEGFVMGKGNRGSLGYAGMIKMRGRRSIEGNDYTGGTCGSGSSQLPEGMNRVV